MMQLHRCDHPCVCRDRLGEWGNKLSKVLLIGFNPPQLLKDTKIEAAHYRTWQFLQPLIDDGHEICLCAGARGEPALSNAQDMPAEWRGQVRYHPMPFGRVGWQPLLQAAHDSFQPDCIVAVNYFQCLYATRLKTDRPIWMDLYGEIFTLIQAANFRTQTDRGLQTTIEFVRDILQTGDAFSGCSLPQQHAIVGELGMAGRLNRHTFGFEFAHTVLPGAPPIPKQMPARPTTRTLLQPLGIAPDDFVVLWCGGYNTWTDVDTLFKGLEQAMAAAPRLHYVSVGASTYAGPDNVYERFCNMAKQSRFAERFHLLGWRPWSEMKQFYAESNVGINIDALHYETIYGTRTRLVEMIASGLPVVTSLGAELSYLLQARDAALTFAVGDATNLGRQLATLAAQPERCRALAQAAYSYAADALSFATTTLPLRQWVRTAQLAPDKLPRHRIPMPRQIEYRARTALRQALWRITGADA